MLKNKPREDKNKNELKNLLSDIIATKKVEKRREAPAQAVSQAKPPRVDVMTKQESSGLDIRSQLENILKVDIE
jgi:hypothetical protein